MGVALGVFLSLSEVFHNQFNIIDGPSGSLFRYSSWLMAALTVVLAGKGVAALQEAGWIDIAPLSFVPRLSIIGLFPTLETIAAQILVLVALVLGFAVNRRRVAAD